MRTIILLIGLMVSFSATAVTYKWVDENGVTQYGDMLPPQAINGGMSEMNKKGQVVRKIDPALTAEQKKAQQAELDKQKEIDKQNEERRRRDQALMGTYISEGEIDLARDRNAQQIDGTLRAAQERIVASQNRGKDLIKQQEHYQSKDKAGKPRVTPKELLDDIEQNKKEQAALNAAVIELQKQKEQVIARFNDDKIRFRELKTGMSSENQPSSKASKAIRASTPFVINESSQALVNNCLNQWTDSHSRDAKNYAASGELIQSDGKTELVLDGRLRNKAGQFAPRRVVCPLTADGKVDVQGVETKKALASLGGNY